MSLSSTYTFSQEGAYIHHRVLFGQIAHNSDLSLINKNLNNGVSGPGYFSQMEGPLVVVCIEKYLERSLIDVVFFHHMLYLYYKEFKALSPPITAWSLLPISL